MPTRATRPPAPQAPRPRSSLHSSDAARAWRRWIAGLRAGPLARAFAGFDALELDATAIELWDGAVRETGWRLVASAARERLLPAARGSDQLQVWIAGAPLVVPLARLGAFELDSPRLAEIDDPRLDGPFALLDEIVDREGLPTFDHIRLEAELLDSIRNLAQARLARLVRERLVGAAELAGDPRLSDPEHFVTDGHPWHVMARTRLGLRPAEVVRHAPEQLAGAAIGCVEIAAELAQVTGDWLDEAARWFGRASPGFVRVPVHPAQRRRLARLYPELLADGRIRPIEIAPVSSRSLLSLRTVALAPDRHLKLAVDVHTTSTRRWVSPMSVHNGPELTRTLAHLQARDPIAAKLRVLGEPSAAGLAPERIGALAGQLGAIFRDVPTATGERAWVCAAIDERWPGRPERVLELAASGYPGGSRERLEALVDAWIAELIPPALRLFVGYGIALELHLQNTLVRVREGRVLGFCVRDLGGIRIHGPRLAEAGLVVTPSFAPGSFILTDDLDEVRGKLEHTLFHAHLTHLFTVAGRLGVDEDGAWARTRALVRACLNSWAGDLELPPGFRTRAALELTELTRPRVRAKALLRMRLRERSSDYDYTEVDNALAEPG